MSHSLSTGFCLKFVSFFQMTEPTRSPKVVEPTEPKDVPAAVSSYDDGSPICRGTARGGVFCSNTSGSMVLKRSVGQHVPVTLHIRSRRIRSASERQKPRRRRE